MEENLDEISDFDKFWSNKVDAIHYQKLTDYKKKIINFDFHHLVSSNSTFVDKDLEEKKKTFDNFKTYEKFFEKQEIFIDQNKRLKIINKNFLKILSKKG